MLTTDDVNGAVFGPMRTAYGRKWNHGDKALKVWRNALTNYDLERLSWAVNAALAHHVNDPPTLPQFLALLRAGQQQPTTYLPAPKFPRVAAVANIALMKVLMEVSGVDAPQLEQLVALKNALVDECDDPEHPTKDWVADTYRQLKELALARDAQAVKRETAIARERLWGTYAGYRPASNQ